MRNYKFFIFVFMVISYHFISFSAMAEYSSAGGSTVGISHAGVNMRDTGVNTSADRGVDNDEFISVQSDDNSVNINNDSYNLFGDGSTKTLSNDKPEPINPYKVMSIDDQNKRKVAVIAYQDSVSNPIIRSVSITKIDKSKNALNVVDDESSDDEDEADVDEEDNEVQSYEEAEKIYEEALQLAQKRYDEAMDAANKYYGVDNKAYDNSVSAADAEYKNAVEAAEKEFNDVKIALAGPNSVQAFDDDIDNSDDEAPPAPVFFNQNADVSSNPVSTAVPINVMPEVVSNNNENVNDSSNVIISSNNSVSPVSVSSNIDSLAVSDAFVQDLLNNPSFKNAMSNYNKPNIIIIANQAPKQNTNDGKPMNQASTLAGASVAGIGAGLASAGAPMPQASTTPGASVAGVGAGIASALASMPRNPSPLIGAGIAAGAPFNKNRKGISFEDQRILDKLKKSIGYAKNRLPTDEEFKRLIDENPRNPVLFEALALISRNKGLNVSAVTFWDRAIEMNPRNMDYYYERAITLNHLNDYKKAIYDLDYIIDFGCDHQANYEMYFDCRVSDAYQMKIDIYTNLKDFFKVDEVYTAKIEKANENDKPTAYYERATFRAGIKNYNDAISDLELAIQFIRNRIGKIDGIVPPEFNPADNPEYTDLLEKKEELQDEMSMYQSEIDMYKGDLKTFQNKNI